MRQVELQRRDRDVALGQSRDIGVRVGIGTAEIGMAPEVHPAARIDAAVESFDVRGHVLRQHAHAPDRPLLETGDVDIEQRPGLDRMSQQLFDDAPRQFGVTEEEARALPDGEWQAMVAEGEAGQLGHVVVATSGTEPVGLAIIGYGGSLVFRGWTEKFREHLDAQGQAGTEGSAYVLAGKVGYIAKGVAIALVGSLFVYAALEHQPKKSGGLDQALQTVLEQPFGQVILVAIGLGIGAYGVFCFARAKHLSR